MFHWSCTCVIVFAWFWNKCKTSQTRRWEGSRYGNASLLCRHRWEPPSVSPLWAHQLAWNTLATLNAPQQPLSDSCQSVCRVTGIRKIWTRPFPDGQQLIIRSPKTWALQSTTAIVQCLWWFGCGITVTEQNQHQGKKGFLTLNLSQIVKDRKCKARCWCQVKGNTSNRSLYYDTNTFFSD